MHEELSSTFYYEPARKKHSDHYYEIKSVNSVKSTLIQLIKKKWPLKKN